MRKLCLILLPVFLLAACSVPGGGRGEEEQSQLTVLATTYPVYLFASALAENVGGVAVERLSTGQVSCLHDYTLSVDDMKKIQRADVIAMNGAELEEFMEDALSASDAAVIDCSQGVELLENREHHHEGEDHDDHDHGHWDPHYWMDPERAGQMVANLQNGLAQADPEHASVYQENGQKAALLLSTWDSDIRDLLAEEGMPEITGLITFHDGFQYFSQATGLNLLKAIEEEEGAEASAAEIQEIVSLIGQYDIPAIFTEVNGSDATAQAISRETGCEVYQLDMIMSGDGTGIQPYIDAMEKNMDTILEALG